MAREDFKRLGYKDVNVDNSIVNDSNGQQTDNTKT